MMMFGVDHLAIIIGQEYIMHVRRNIMTDYALHKFIHDGLCAT